MASQFEYIRDRAVEEIKHASKTVSENARTIGIGLALAVYTLVLTGEHQEILRQHKQQLVLASFFGVMCVALDYLQYYFMIGENRSILRTMREQRDQVRQLVGSEPEKAKELARQFLVEADRLRESTLWSTAREFCFHAKFVCAMFGALVLVGLIWALLTIPISLSAT